MLPRGFWDKIKRGEPNQCWPWLAHTCQGYGHVRVGPKIMKAHRLVHEEAHGPIPHGMVIMHLCDNRRCCNLAHLSIGWPSDNNRDRDRKGRQVSKRGEAHGMSKLREKQVAELIAFRTEITRRVSEYARRFKVANVTIRDVLAKRTWNW